MSDRLAGRVVRGDVPENIFRQTSLPGSSHNVHVLLPPKGLEVPNVANLVTVNQATLMDDLIAQELAKAGPEGIECHWLACRAIAGDPDPLHFSSRGAEFNLEKFDVPWLKR